MKKLETLKSNDVYISAIVYLRFSAFIVFYVYSSGFFSFEPNYNIFIPIIFGLYE